MKSSEGYLDWRKLNYKYIFNHCCVVVGHAFARLKACRQFLTAQLPAREENVASVFGVCAVLHHIYETQWHEPSCNLLAQEYLVIPHQKIIVEPKDGQILLEGRHVYDAIADFLLEVHDTAF